MKFARNAQSLDASYIREILSAANQPEMISMAGGLPASSFLPVELVRSTCEALADNRHLFQYGNSQGYSPLLSTLQRSAKTQNPWLICNGSQQALDLIARALLEPGDQVIAEIPAYLGALQVFQLSGIKVCPLMSSTNGPDLDQLENYLKGGNIKLFYSVPDFHNPTGRVWSTETRIAVAKLCRHYGVTLVEDAPYRELRFAGEQLDTVSEHCPELSISLKSFSKIGFPGLRVGAMSGPADFIAVAERIKQATDLHTGIPQQAMIDALLNHPQFNEHLLLLRQGYQARYQHLSNALQQQLGDLVQFDTVEGGMFVWLTLSQGNSSDVAARALQHKLAVVPGAAFYPIDMALENNALRLNFSNTDPTFFPEAVNRLAQALGPMALTA